MTVSDKNKELIKNFRELLLYGSSKLQAFPLHKDKYRLKKQILYIMMAATQSYSEAILKLMDNQPIYDKAAEVIYRSLVENLINLSYIYSTRTQENALIFLAFSIQDNNDFVKKYKTLMLKYPEWKLDFAGLDTSSKCDDYINKNNKFLAKSQKKYKITLSTKLPDIRKRVIQYYEYLKLKNKFNKKNNLEFSYVMFYKFFSQIAHLTMPGLERFLIREADGSENVEIDSDEKSIGRILPITYQMYFVFLRFTLQTFDIYNKNEFKKFKVFSKNLVKMD
jgi:hypothetical protein